MSITPPENYTYGTVVGRFLSSIADSADADRYPDVIPATGKVVFTPNATYYKNTAWPATFINTPIEGTLDAAGFLVDNRGAPGVVLMATDHPDISPSGWTYKVTMTINGRQFTPFDIKVEGGQTIDLTTVMPASTSAGAITIVSEASRIAAEAAAAEAVEAAALAHEVVNDGVLAVAVVTPDPDTVPKRTASGALAVSAPTSDTHAVNKAYLRTTGAILGVPISEFLLPGESLDPTGATDMSVIAQRAINNVGVSFGPVQIVWPDGNFRILTGLVPRSKVGIKGSGRNQTVFTPVAGQCFMIGNLPEPWVDTWLDDMAFSDFKVDCTQQTWGSYNGALKAFYMQNLRRCTWERVDAVGSWASMYGVDFLVDCVFNDCVGTGSGRGVPPTVAGTGSTFAFGVGRHAGESITLINCRAVGAAAGGYFFERLEDRGATRQDGVFRIIGGTTQGCGIGVVDCGAGAILADNILIENSTHVGWFIGPGGQSSVGGVNGRVTGIIRGTLAGMSDNGAGGGHGVQIKGGPAAGGYVFSGVRFENNAGSPIYAGAGHSISDGGFTVRGCRLDKAIVMRSSVTDTKGLVIDSNQIILSAGGPALDLTTGLNAPRIVGNSVTGADSLLRVDGSRLPADPVVRDNNVPGASALATGGTVEGSRVSGNTLSVTPPGVLYYDSLKSVSGTVNGLGDGWSATAGTGLTALAWVRTPNGARPDGSAHSAQHRDLGVSGVRVSAILEATTATPRRRGVQLAVNPTTGIAVIAEAEAGSSGFYRLIRQGSTGTRTTIWTSTVPASESHEVGLSRPTGSTVTTMWIDGVPVQTVDVSQIPVSTYAGVVGYSGALSKISDFTVRAVG